MCAPVPSPKSCLACVGPFTDTALLPECAHFALSPRVRVRGRVHTRVFACVQVRWLRSHSVQKRTIPATIRLGELPRNDAAAAVVTDTLLANFGKPGEKALTAAERLLESKPVPVDIEAKIRGGCERLALELSPVVPPLTQNVLLPPLSRAPSPTLHHARTLERAPAVSIPPRARAHSRRRRGRRLRTLSFRYVLSKFELFHLRSEQEKVEAEVRERTKQREMAQYSARDSAAQMLDEIRFLRKHTPKAERPSLRDELPAAVEANLRVGHMLSGPLLEELRQGYHKWCKEEATQEVPRELRERILSGHCLSQVR